MSSLWDNFMGVQIRHDGRRYVGRFAEAGAGEALFLLHGHGGHLESFARNIRTLARHFHVFALDAVWHGLGPQPPFDPELMPVFLDQILDFMDWRGIGAAHFEGQSMGGWTAMRMALDHPDRVKKLVLTTTQGFKSEIPGIPSGAPPGPPSSGAPAAPPAPGQGPVPTFAEIQARIRNNVVNPDEIGDDLVESRVRIYSNPVFRLNQDLLSRSYAGVRGNADTPAKKWALGEDDLRRIAAPALVYWGEKNALPPPYGERLASLIPNARYHCEPETGQWAQYEHADTHNRVVLQFLTGDSTLQPPAYTAT
jgi:2-hydroxy-6-oxonona-2,4-dienedioate hydrolase